MPTLPQPTLQGSHVRLEPLSLAHLDALVAVASGPRDTYRLTMVPDGPEAEWEERNYCDRQRSDISNQCW